MKTSTDPESRAEVLARDRPMLDGMNVEQLVAEYLWCEQTAQRALDEMDLHALNARRCAIENRLGYTS